MSGGHFNYDQYRISQIADDIQLLISNNDDVTENKWGDHRGYGFTDDTLNKFKQAVDTLRKAAIMAQRIDYLVSGDDGEDSFHRHWTRELGE